MVYTCSCTQGGKCRIEINQPWTPHDYCPFDNWRPRSANWVAAQNNAEAGQNGLQQPQVETA